MSFKDYLDQGYNQEQAERLAMMTADPWQEPEVTPAAPAESEPTTVTRAKGKSAGGRSRTRRGSADTTPKVGAIQQGQQEIRAWAKAKGIEVPSRGGIPKLVREMFDEEMGVHA